MPKMRNDLEARLYAVAQGLLGLSDLRRAADHAPCAVGRTWCEGGCGVDASRTVRPVTPIFSILLTLALPIGQLMAFCAWHESEIVRLLGGRFRRLWPLDDAMVKAGGFEFLSSLGSAVTYPFLQTEGHFALILAFLLFPVFTIFERKAGHVRFLMIIAILWITSLAAHAVQIVGCPSECAYLCGIGPIALGTIAYLRKAYPNLRFQWMKGCSIASIYLFLVAMILLMERCFGCLGVESYSFAFLALVSCGALGAWLGRHSLQCRPANKVT